MTPGELLPIIRETYLQDVSDALDPELVQEFTDAWLLREVATAQRQACYRQDLRHLYDDETAALCSIALTAERASYPLDKRILRLDGARIGDQVLVHTTRAALDRARPGWALLDAGTPRWFVVVGRNLVLVPAPAADVVTEPLRLAVWRLPLTDPNMGDELEWGYEPEQLAHWVAYRAFSLPNSGFDDPKRAAQYRVLFDMAFGPEVPAAARAELLAYPNQLDLMPSVPGARPACDLEDWYG